MDWSLGIPLVAAGFPQSDVPVRERERDRASGMEDTIFW